MKNIGALLAFALLGGCTLPHGKTTPASNRLVFRGTVTSIVNSPLPKSNRNWIATMRVDHVEQGQFSGSEFSFRVHSPSRAGLHPQGTYRVEATLTPDGYVVDELQWNR